MWIQLLSARQITVMGEQRRFQPGDWVDVGEQTARRWIADGLARSAVPMDMTADLAGGGVRVVAGVVPKSWSVDLVGLEVSEGDADLPYAKTALLDTDAALRSALIPVGLRLLNTWEVAAPIVSYDLLAVHIGTPAERSETEAVIRDLRVPVYDPRVLFVRRCLGGEAFLDAYLSGVSAGGDERLALLRALYTVKPLFCPLPVGWLQAA